MTDGMEDRLATIRSYYLKRLEARCWPDDLKAFDLRRQNVLRSKPWARQTLAAMR